MFVNVCEILTSVSEATPQQCAEVGRILNLYPSGEEATTLYDALGEKKQKSLDEVVRKIAQIRATESQRY